MRKSTLTGMFTDQMPPAEDQMFSVGACCQLMQITPAQLQVLMAECGIRFTGCVDSVPYVTGDGLELLQAKHREVLAEIDRAAKLAQNAPNN